jgi:hypothetical protein
MASRLGLVERQGQQQIPFGDDNQKGNSNGGSVGNDGLVADLGEQALPVFLVAAVGLF